MTPRLNHFPTCLKGLFLLLVAGAFTACDRQIVYYSCRSLPIEGWRKEDTLRFEVVVPDSQTVYKLSVELRNRDNYPYQNIALSVCYDTPDSLSAPADSLLFTLTDAQGHWNGRGLNNLYTYQWDAGDVPIGKSGTYLFKLSPLFPDELLEGVNDVGIRLDRKRTP